MALAFTLQAEISTTYKNGCRLWVVGIWSKLVNYLTPITHDQQPTTDTHDQQPKLISKSLKSHGWIYSQDYT